MMCFCCGGGVGVLRMAIDARVAMRIADVTGRRIGPIDSGQQRYVEPTRKMDGERTKPVSRQ